MEAMSWSARHRTGIAKLDSQHQNLFKRLNDLRFAVAAGKPAGIAQAFPPLLQSMTEHFTTEEEYLKQHVYPGLAKQSKDHIALLQRFSQAQSLGAGISLALIEELSRLFDEHCAGADLAYAEFLREQGVK